MSQYLMSQYLDKAIDPRAKKEEEETLDCYDYAAIRYVWSLDQEYKDILDRHFLLRCTVRNFCSRIDRSHQFRDCILYKGQSYEIVYHQCSYRMLAGTVSLEHDDMLLSLRRTVDRKCAVALVKLARGGKLTARAKATYQELV